MRLPAGDRRWTAIGAATVVAVVVSAAAAALAAGDARPERVRAIAFAAVVCLVGGVGGWLAGRMRPSGPALAVGAGLAAVALRFFPAVLAVAWIRVTGGTLAEHGAAEWLLVFYLAVLATDIPLHIMGARRDRGANAEN